MSKLGHRPIPAVLPTAYVVLRLLMLLNWLMGAVILFLLLAMPYQQWILTSLELAPGAEADRVIALLRGIALVGVICIPLHYAILKRLVAMVETVGAGDPFVPDNARRLETIAWVLLLLQGLGIVVGLMAGAISTRAHPMEMGGLSLSGLLAVVMTFVLARVFAAGTEMRDELEATV